MDYNIRPTLSTGHQNSNGYVLNVKIVVCAVIILFVVVLILVCFQSCARWLSHRYHRRGRAHQLFFLSAAAANTNSNGDTVHPQALDLSVLKRIPTFVHSSAGTKEEMLECAVCLSKFEDKERGRELPKCKHVFHVDCIDKWFHSHSNCPLCRIPVHPPAEVMSVTAPAYSITEREGSEMGCSSNSSLPSLELANILVEMPRGRGNFRGFDDMALSSSEGTWFKSPGNRVLSFKRIWSI